MTAYKRVLLKLSGEVFGGGEIGLDPATHSEEKPCPATSESC